MPSSTDETLIIYCSIELSLLFNMQYRDPDPEYIKKFFRHVDENGRRYRIDNLANPAYRPNLIYEYKGYKPPKNGWAISQEKMKHWDAEGRLYFPKKADGRIQIKRYLDELKGIPLSDFWDDVLPVASQASSDSTILRKSLKSLLSALSMLLQRRRSGCRLLLRLRHHRRCRRKTGPQVDCHRPGQVRHPHHPQAHDRRAAPAQGRGQGLSRL